MKLPKFKNYTGQPVKYIQPKMDGHMMHVFVDGVGQIKVYSKNDKNKTEKLMSIEHIRDELMQLPFNTELFAELHCPDVYSTDIPTLLNDSDSQLQLSVFACPLLGGEDYYYEDIRGIMEILGEIGMYVIPVSLATRGFDCTYRAQLLEDATKFKLEGWVLKESHMEGWYKLKPVKTIDAFVVDVTESDSETYKGYMKAVKLGIYDWNSRHTPTHDLGECGIGFNKEFKLSKSYSDMRVDLIGRVCEIAFDSFTKDHKLRFPRFIRWRDDKDMTNCTTEQLK